MQPMRSQQRYKSNIYRSYPSLVPAAWGTLIKLAKRHSYGKRLYEVVCRSRQLLWIAKNIPMNKRLLLTCLVLAVLYMPDQAYAQFNDPRTYDNTPVGINQIELGYTYVHANASIDGAVTVEGAKLNLNQGIAQYTRYSSFLHRLMWMEVGVPIANLAGSITGTNISRSTTSAGDSSYRVGNALEGRAFTERVAIPKLQANYNVGCEPLHHSTHAPIQPQQDPQSGFGSVGVQDLKSRSRIHLVLTRDGSSTHTPTSLFSRTTLHITGMRSCGKNRYRGLKAILAIH